MYKLLKSKLNKTTLVKNLFERERMNWCMKASTAEFQTAKHIHNDDDEVGERERERTKLPQSIIIRFRPPCSVSKAYEV